MIKNLLKKIIIYPLFALSFFVIPFFASASAPVYDNGLGWSGGGTNTTNTQAYTVNSNTNGVLFVAFEVQNGNSAPGNASGTTVTYNGVSMSNYGNSLVLNSNDSRLFVYILKAPASGTHNIVVDVTYYDAVGGASPSLSNVLAKSFTNVDQTTIVQNATLSDQIATLAVNLTVTTSKSNSFVISFADKYATTLTDNSSQSNLINSTSGSVNLYSGNKSVVSPTTTALNYTAASNSFTGGTIGWELLGYAPAGPANMKTRNGLASASIKTINNLAIANIKTINGLN